MSTTDTDALTERIARAAATSEGFGPDHPDHEVVLGEHLFYAQFLAPFIAAEVRKAKAEAFDEGWKDRARRDVHRAYAFIDERRNVPGPPASLNPYRDTGDSDDHR